MDLSGQKLIKLVIFLQNNNRILFADNNPIKSYKLWKKLVNRDHLAYLVNELGVIVEKFTNYCWVLKPNHLLKLVIHIFRKNKYAKNTLTRFSFDKLFL